MAKFLDLDLGVVTFSLRLLAALVFASVDIFLLYYVPTHLNTLISEYLPINNSSNIENMIAGLVSPSLPLVGIAVSLVAFFGILFKGSKIYGLILALTGILFSFCTYLFFQGGTMFVHIPSGLIQGISGSVVMDLTILMWLLMLPSLLTIVKGRVLILQAARGRTAASQSKAVSA